MGLTVRNIRIDGYLQGEFSTPAVDPFAQYVELDLIGTGPNNSTNIVDSTNKNVITRYGDAKISTTVSATGSIYLDGNGDYLTAPSSSSLAFGTADFTVETWVYFNAVSGYQVFAMLGSGLDGAPAAYNAWAFYTSNDSEGRNLNFNRYSPTFAGAVTPWSPSTGQWYHVAVSRSGSDLRFFVNGIQIGSTFSNSTNYAVVNSDPLTIGRFQANAGVVYSSDLYLNNLRITNGAARYTSNFTPPTRS